jgi:hypothetical protein
MFHKAPWSRQLRITSALGLALCTAVGGFILIGFADRTPPLITLLGLGCILLPLFAVLFAVRGYTIEPERLVVQRLGWTTIIPLRDLQKVRIDPSAMTRCIRLLGNGGLFAFTGWFFSRPLGKFRAFATDPGRAVILGFSDQTLVVTPEEPELFASELRSACPRLRLD